MKDLFLLLYAIGSSSPVGIISAGDLTWAECDKMAATHTANFAVRNESKEVKCEIRRPTDMIWKLHPEWRF